MKQKIKQLLTKTESSGLNEITIDYFLSKCPYTASELTGQNRKMEIAAWRTIFCFLVYLETGNQTKTSEIIKRNRSAVTYNCNKIINWESDFALKEVIKEFIKNP